MRGMNEEEIEFKKIVQAVIEGIRNDLRGDKDVALSGKSFQILPCVPYQVCPLCNGSGRVPSYYSTSSFDVCGVCNGQRIIPMHFVYTDLKAEQTDIKDSNN